MRQLGTQEMTWGLLSRTKETQRYSPFPDSSQPYIEGVGSGEWKNHHVTVGGGESGQREQGVPPTLVLAGSYLTNTEVL